MKIKLGKFSQRNQLYILISLCLYLTYVILPIIPVILPSIIRYSILLLIICFFLVGIISSGKNIALKVISICCLIFIFITSMYFGKWKHSGVNFVSYIINAYMFWFPFIFSIIIRKYDINKKNKILRYLIFLIAITIITTIIGNHTYESASRILATSSNGVYKNQILQYSKMNIGGYDFIYGLVVIMPYFFYCIQERKNEYLFVILTLMSIYTIVLTQFTFAVGLVCVFFIMLWVFKNKKYYLRFLGVFIMMLIFFVLKKQMLIILYSIQSGLFSKGFLFLADRMESVIDMLFSTKLTGDALLRKELYFKSINAFLKCPIIGNIFEYHELGGHSEILDIAGGTGVFGIMLLSLFLYIHMRNIKVYRGSSVYKYGIISFILFLLIAIFNTVTTSPAIAISLFLVPALLDSREKIKKKDIEKDICE